MARSAARRAFIRASGRIENAMADLEKEGGDTAVEMVRQWLVQEYLTPERPEQPEAVQSGFSTPVVLADPVAEEKRKAAK